MSSQQLLHSRRNRGWVANHAKATLRHDRLGRTAPLKQLGQNLLSNLAANNSALNQLHQLSQLLGLKGQVGNSQPIGIYIGGNIAGDPVGDALGVGAGRYRGLEVFGHRALIGKHSGVVDRQTQLLGVAVPLSRGQLGQLGAPALPLGVTHLDGAKVGIWEVAIVTGALLTAHALGELLCLVPKACFLPHRLTGFIGLDLALNLVINRLLNSREGIHILDLHLRTEGGIAAAPHGDIHIATQGTLLHVAVTHAQITHDPANLRGVFRCFAAGAQIRFADNLSESYTGAVVVHQGVGGAV